MLSIKYSSHPQETDELIDLLCGSYVFISEDYSLVFIFREFLKNLPLCDFSEIMDDYIYEKGGVTCQWVIFFTCVPKDAYRLYFTSQRVMTILDVRGKLLDAEKEVDISDEIFR